MQPGLFSLTEFPDILQVPKPGQLKPSAWYAIQVPHNATLINIRSRYILVGHSPPPCEVVANSGNNSPSM